jgi:hypothetical protein
MEREVLDSTTPEGLIVDFQSEEVAQTGLHPGVISNVENLGEKTIKKRNTRYTSNPTARWVGIVVDLIDQTDADGNPMKVRVDVTLGGTLDSHLRKIFRRLNMISPKGGQVPLRSLIGVEVDVFIVHERGSNKSYKWAKVAPEDLTLRGKGRVRPVALSIPDDPDGIVMWNKTTKRSGVTNA